LAKDKIVRIKNYFQTNGTKDGKGQLSTSG